MNMIDLHTHTTYSDGTDDVITLLKNAEKSKLEVLSITLTMLHVKLTKN